MDQNNNASSAWDPNATPHITLGRDKYAYIKYQDGKEYLDIREIKFIGNSLKRQLAGVLLSRDEWQQFKQKFANPEYVMVSFSKITLTLLMAQSVDMKAKKSRTERMLVRDHPT